MKRVMIVGQPGSGKSTLARRIGQITGLPVIHIDQIHWQSGWVERDKSAKLELATAAENQPRWVFEGGFSTSYENRLNRADTLLVLEFPLSIRAWRVFKRTLQHYGKTRPDLPDGCPERFSWEFWKWIWDTRHSGLQQNRRLIEKAGSVKQVIVLKSASDVQAYLRTLDAG